MSRGYQVFRTVYVSRLLFGVPIRWEHKKQQSPGFGVAEIAGDELAAMTFWVKFA